MGRPGAGSWKPAWEAVWEAVSRLLPRLVPGTSLDTIPDRVLTQVWVASLQSDAGVGGLTHVGVMRSATWVATKRSTLA